jgi:hypothetical protein
MGLHKKADEKWHSLKSTIGTHPATFRYKNTITISVPKCHRHLPPLRKSISERCRSISQHQEWSHLRCRQQFDGKVWDNFPAAWASHKEQIFRPIKQIRRLGRERFSTRSRAIVSESIRENFSLAHIFNIISGLQTRNLPRSCFPCANHCSRIKTQQATQNNQPVNKQKSVFALLFATGRIWRGGNLRRCLSPSRERGDKRAIYPVRQKWAPLVGSVLIEPRAPPYSS